MEKILKRFDDETKLHNENLKNIDEMNCGMFLQIVENGKEDIRHCKIMEKIKKDRDEYIKKFPSKVTVFKKTFKRHTNFANISILEDSSSA